MGCIPWGHRESDITDRLSTPIPSSSASGRMCACELQLSEISGLEILRFLIHSHLSWQRVLYISCIMLNKFQFIDKFIS